MTRVLTPELMTDFITRAYLSGSYGDFRLMQKPLPVTPRQQATLFSGRDLQASGRELDLLRGQGDLLDTPPAYLGALTLIGYATERWSRTEAGAHQIQLNHAGSLRRSLLRALAGQVGPEPRDIAGTGNRTLARFVLPVSLIAAALLSRDDLPQSLQALRSNLREWHTWVLASTEHTGLPRADVMELARNGWLQALPDGRSVMQAARESGLDPLSFGDRATLMAEAQQLIHHRPTLIQRADQLIGAGEPLPRNAQERAALLYLCQTISLASNSDWAAELEQAAFPMLGFEPQPELRLPTPRLSGSRWDWTSTALPGGAREALRGTVAAALRLLTARYRPHGIQTGNTFRHPEYLIGMMLRCDQRVAARLLEALLLNHPDSMHRHSQYMQSPHIHEALKHDADTSAELQVALTLLRPVHTELNIPFKLESRTQLSPAQLLKYPEHWVLIAAQRRHEQIIQFNTLNLNGHWPVLIGLLSLRQTCHDLISEQPAWHQTMDAGQTRHLEELSQHLSDLIRHFCPHPHTLPVPRQENA